MSSSPAFVHLRLHSEYSVVDSVIRIKPLVEKVARLGMPAVALTDQVNFYALIKFYTAARAKGIKPLCGCDLYVSEDGNPEQVHVLPLLVRDQVGYRNLIRLISRAYQEGQHRGTVAVKRSWLAGQTEGLIALSGAARGDVGKALLAGDYAQARALLEEWKRLFPDAYYLELQRTGRTGDGEQVVRAVALAGESDTPVVATNDVRFLDPQEFEAHEVRVCINDRRTLDDPRRPRLYSEQQYLRSTEEMQELFSDLPEALQNSVEIARRCNLDLVLGKPFLPNYPIPEGMSIEEFMRQESLRGLEERLAALYDPAREDMAKIRQTYLERLDFELGIINQMGFPGYFLIVMEFIQWAKDNGIPVGPGRGSGAGSLVAYSLKITDLDPLQYDLLFERFLNPERVSMPDFDVDFCMDGRDRVIEHVADLYGHDAVSQIITFGTMAAKAVIRDVARVQGKSYALADKLSKLVPFEVGMTLEKALQDEPALGEFLAADEEAQEIMEMAQQLEGLVRNVGKHAGGVVIAPTKLTDFTPLYCDESGGNLVAQFDKNDVESAGLVKFDFLGLRTLTIIDWAVKMLNEGRPEAELIDITRIPLDDAKVYELLERGETTAVFQLESRGMKDLIKRLKPSNFEDIIALVALFRPGPLGSGMVDDFIDRKHGRKQVSYPHPDLEDVLKNTYGVILYQEQVMQIAQVLASYTLGGADMLRRAMGKKKPEEMQKQRAVFLEGAAARGISATTASSIFDLMEKFADYGFNTSQSAAYALVSYQTAWLKRYHPAHFMAAVLTADMQNTDKIVTLVEECRRMGLSLLPPDVNVGRYAFTVDDGGRIVYGLGAIKGLGAGPVEAILRAREAGGEFRDLFDFCQRVDPGQLNKRVLEALIRSGACDGFGADRAVLLAAVADAVKMAEQNQRAQASGVADLFGAISPAQQESADAYAAYRRIHRWSEQRRLQEEKETLGLYLSGHPIAEFLPELAQLTKNRLDALKPDKAPQLVAGLIHDMRLIQTKRGDRICILTLDDQSGRIEASLYSDVQQQYQEQLIKDKVVVLEGVVSVDDYNGDGRLQVRARRVLSLEQARRQYARGLRLALHSPQLSVESLAFLRALLARHGGTESAPPAPWEEQGGEGSPASETLCQVVVDLATADVRGTLSLGAKWRVAPSEDLLVKLRENLGQDAVSLSYQ
ncbi:MAG: DNA polymerase III subunit alpha [Pseudomonadales bacterium]|jgi:DNA polymerase-3 subunit alpha|nr:DNA polymerase III subunit alpha [Pseudomonadales bacterium]